MKLSDGLSISSQNTSFPKGNELTRKSADYLNLVRKIKEIKNTNNTFLVKLIDSLINKIKGETSLFADIEALIQELIRWCDESNNISMKSRLTTRMAEIYLINERFQKSLEAVHKGLFDLKKYDDNLGLIEIQLIESKVHFESKGIAKSKVFI